MDSYSLSMGELLFARDFKLTDNDEGVIIRVGLDFERMKMPVVMQIIDSEEKTTLEICDSDWNLISGSIRPWAQEFFAQQFKKPNYRKVFGRMVEVNFQSDIFLRHQNTMLIRNLQFNDHIGFDDCSQPTISLRKDNWEKLEKNLDCIERELEFLSYLQKIGEKIVEKMVEECFIKLRSKLCIGQLENIREEILSCLNEISMTSLSGNFEETIFKLVLTNMKANCLQFLSASVLTMCIEEFGISVATQL